MDLGEAERSRSPSAASPVAFWFLCRHGQRNPPPAGGGIPLQNYISLKSSPSASPNFTPARNPCTA